MLRRLLLLMAMLCLPMYGQKIAGTGATGPNGAGIGRNGSTNWLYLPTDSSGNLMTNGTGSGGPPQIASKNATGPLGALIGWYAAGSEWLYVPVDANGNLEVNCVTGCSSGSGIANTTFTNATTAIGGNACSASAVTVTMTGVASTSVFMITPNADVSGSSGWGSTGGLVIDAWPTTNTLNYKICNQTAASITPGAVTWNVGAR